MPLPLRAGLKPTLLTVLIALIAPLGLAACSSDDEEIVYEERPVEEIYQEALDELESRNYQAAAAQFDEVERQHPYSAWARRAMLMAAYAYYLQNDYDSAILTSERFIALHPGNERVSYAYYLIAQSYYEQIVDVGRDQKTTEQALNALNEIVRRFPNSEYARDARLKIDLTRDHLAGKEMDIGRWYMRRSAYIAAINRFKTVVTQYQTTTHVPEALHRLTEAYTALGVMHEAQTAAAVLGHNFPGTDWYEDSYGMLTERGYMPEENQGSWISQAWSSVF